MADLKSTRIFGWLKVLGDADVKGELKEKGQRVYSPNNPNITTSVTSTSTSLYASASAVKTAYDRGSHALNTANSKQNNLGYTPVQQGGGPGQGSNTVKIGWATSGSNQLLLQVDSTNFGSSWPMTSKNSEKLGGQASSYYAKASQVLTNVPAGAKFTDTQRPLSTSVSSTSTTTAATSSAAKTAYDRGSHALNVANGKVTANEARTAVSNDGIGQLNIGNRHFITENDGGGNFNRRVGHRRGAGDIPTEYGRHTAFHEVFDNDTSNGRYTFKIATGITNNSAITNWRTPFQVSYTQFKIWDNVFVVNNDRSVFINGVEFKPAVNHYYTTGNVTVDLSVAMKHSITRWGTGNGTVTITGTGVPGTEVVINNIRTDSGTCTITGRRMFTGEGTNQETTHTITGQGSVTFVSHNGTELMLASAIKGKVAQ